MSRLALIGPEPLRRGVYRAAFRRLGLRLQVSRDADDAPDLSQIDAVVLAGPGRGSRRLLAELAAVGKPALCPPSMSAMIDAPWPGMFAGSHLRFAADAGRVRDRLQAGELGRPVRVTATLGGPPPPHAVAAEFWDRSITGGGALLDPGADLLDLLGWWLGPLAARRLCDDGAGGAEAEAVVEFDAPGASGEIRLSRLRRLNNTITLSGPDGRIAFDLESGAREPAAVLQARRIAAWLGADVTAPACADVETGRVLTALYARRERLLHPWERSAAPGSPELKGHKVLVAGATSFIGARATEGLVAGHEVVFNLAYDVKQPGDYNLAAWRVLADACAKAKVRRLVQASSIAVYDGWPAQDLTEASPKDGGGHEYKRTKRLIELDLMARAAAGDFEAVVLQPTIVYGPFGGLWTDAIVERLQAGAIAAPQEGLCNGVYVDDVVAAFLSAATAPDASGEAFIVSGPAPFRWFDLITGYAEALGAEAVADRALPAGPAPRPSLLRRIMNDPLALADWPPAQRALAFVRSQFGDEVLERLRARVTGRRGLGPATYRPAADNPALYRSRAVCSIEKLSRALGPPNVPLVEGLALTQAYIRWRSQGSPAP